MRFALFGIDPESGLLADASVALGHECVWCGDVAVSADFGELPWLPAEDRAGQWEELFDPHVCDAVIVGRGATTPEIRAEQANQLVKNGGAVLASFPLVDSVLKFYEIDMSRSESGAVLHHFNPLVEQQALLKQWAVWIRHGHPQIGAIEQIVWKRPLEVRSREGVLWHFARDVELLNQIAGSLNRLGAHGSPDEGATYSGLSVQLLGESKVPVRWEVGPVEESAWPRLALIGQRGKLAVKFNESGQAMLAEVSQGGQSQTLPYEGFLSAPSAIKRFVKALLASDRGASTWPDALHAMELTDTIEISLRRGRMIDVHSQQLTEQLAFKGTMSAVGCGVLMILPPLLLALGFLAEKIGLPVAEYWAHCLLALLAIFLAVQLVPKLLFKSSETEAKPKSDGEGE